MDLVSIILSVTVVLILYNVFSKKDNKYQNFPPGPKPLPIIGNMHMIDTVKPHKSLMEMSKKYGTVFSIQVGSDKCVIMCGYETVKDALINYAEEFSGRPDSPVSSMTSKGYGILFSHGENWKVMRKFTLTTLRDFGMGKKTIEEKISEECENLVQTFRSYGGLLNFLKLVRTLISITRTNERDAKKPNEYFFVSLMIKSTLQFTPQGKPFENQSIMNTAVANIIVSILLDYRFEYDDPTVMKLMNLVNENIRIMQDVMVQLYNSYPTLIGWLPGSHRKLAENYREMQDFVVATFTKPGKDFDVNNQRSFIEAFLAKQLEGKPESKLYYNTKNLSTLVMDLFAAGMETTSTTLRWGLLLMMKYPEIQKKVQNEIESVIGSTQAQTEHRKLMPYTDAVIHEIQRFANIVPGNLPHAAVRDVTFRGYFIPKGTFVVPSLHSVLKDETCFEKPDEFYPEHFLDSEGNFKKNEAFIPFSLGKRSCAGENLAKMELFLFFITLLQNFTFQAPPGAELDLSPAVGLISSPLPHEICAVPH